MKRILFLGAGRRVELLKRFKQRKYEVFSYETSYTVPVADICEVILGKKWKDKDFKEHLLEIVKDYAIDLIIPCQDEAGAVLWWSSLEDISLISHNSVTCFDKLAFQKTMEILFPDNYPSYEGGYPYVKKGRYSFGSNDVEKIYKYLFGPLVDDNYIYQKLIEGKEYSIDAYFDKSGKYIDSVPRTRDRVSSGEVMKSTTTPDKKLQELVKTVGEKLGMVGPINFQVIRDKHGQDYIFEINHRFGGGFTLSMEAGLDVIGLIGKDYFGRKFSYESNKWKGGLVLDRSYRDYFYAYRD